jgi:hypothetical protein
MGINNNYGFCGLAAFRLTFCTTAIIDMTTPAIASQRQYNHPYRWLSSKWNDAKKRYSAGSLAHGIHLSHGSHHVTKMGITGMAGAKISASGGGHCKKPQRVGSGATLSINLRATAF